MVQQAIVIGAGHTGIDYHLPVYKANTNVDVVAICDTDDNKAKSAANSHGVNNIYSNITEALDNHKVDIVSICTPPQYHLEQIRQSIDAGCAVLVEKPLVSNQNELDKLDDLIKEKNGRVTTVHNMKFQKRFEQLRQKVRSDEIGELKHIHTHNLYVGENDRIISSSSHWAHDLVASRWTEEISHQIYIVLQFFDQLEVSNVSVYSNNSDHPGLQVDEFSVMLSSRNGSTSLRYSANAGTKNKDWYFIGGDGTIKLNKNGVYEENQRYIDQLVNINKNMLSNIYKLTKNAINYHFSQNSSSGPGVGHKKLINKFVEFSMGEEQNPVDWDESYNTMALVNQISDEVQLSNIE